MLSYIAVFERMGPGSVITNYAAHGGPGTAGGVRANLPAPPGKLPIKLL